MFVLQSVFEKSKYYTVDEFGVKNYKYLPLGLMSMAVYSLLNILLGWLTYLAEMNSAASPIKSYADALWAMLMSSTTIGFGDVYPITILGKLCVFLMFILGVGILGGVGAIFANKIFGFADTNVKNRELRKQNAEILERTKSLEEKVQELNNLLESIAKNNK